jgi:HK97 gp10 family phage protein
MFKVKITGISSIEKQFTAAAEKIKDTVEQEMQAAAQDWVAGAVRDAPVDQGALKQSISYKQSNTQTQAGTSISFEIVAQRFYAPFIEFGTKGKYQPIPGTEKIAVQFKGYKGGDFMDLLRMIVRWVKRKGIAGTYSVKTRRRTGSKINQYAEDYSAAWPIALSILKNGISPHPFFFKQQEIVWPAMIKRIERILQKETKVSVIAPGDIFRPRIITV